MQFFTVSLFLGFVCAMVLAPMVSAAGSNANLVYSGRILRPDGQGINAGTVSFTLSVKDATNNCVLWKETHSVNMADSAGTFALTVGAGTRSDGGSHTFKQVFVNAGTLTGLSCTSGTSFTPSSGDDRNLVVSFDDAGTVVSLAAVAIKSVPFAMQADQVSGYGIMNLAKISGLGTATTVTGTQFDFLAALAAPASASSTPCANNDVLKYSSGAWTCAAPGGAGAASTSTLTSATGTNSTDNANWTQTWDWSTLSTQTGLSLTSSSSSLAGGTILNVANTGSSTNGTVARIQSNPTAGSGLTVLANGNVGIGTAAPTSALQVVGEARVSNLNFGTGIAMPIDEKVRLINTLTTDNSNFSVFNLMPFWSPAASGGTANAVLISSGFVYNSSNHNSGSATSVLAAFTKMGTGNLPTATGLDAGVSWTGGAGTDVAAGRFAVTSSGGTITNGYGVKIGTVAGTTNKWSIHANDATAPSYFAGNVGIGTPSPAEKLEVTGNVNVGAQTTRTTAATDRGQLALASSFVQTTNVNATVDWNNGNMQEINTFVCDGVKTITFSNTKDGATYSLLLSGSAVHTSTCNFLSAGKAFNTSGVAVGPTPSRNVVFTFAVFGSTIVYSMIDNLQ